MAINCMNTVLWEVDPQDDQKELERAVAPAAALLRAERVVAFPTETVYGLGGDANSTVALKRIFGAKGRPSDNPLIVHVASFDQFRSLVSEVPATAKRLTAKFWPGPLTVVLPKRKCVSTLATGGLDTVAVRMPDHPVALSLIRASKLGIAAPSANLSGKPSPTSALHVLADLNGKIAGIIDGGETHIGVESTVVDCTTTPVTILRPGGLPMEEIRAVLGEVVVDPALLKQTGEHVKPRSPGMKYTHYAPRADLQLVHGSANFVKSLVEKTKGSRKVGVLCTKESAALYAETADHVVVCGHRKDLRTVARKLYHCLREFDENDVEVIFAESFPLDGLGQAIMNRLHKAAGGAVVHETAK